MAEAFRLLYDIEKERWKNLWFVFASAPFLLIGLLAGLFGEREPGALSPWWTFAIVAAFALLWSGVGWWAISGEYARLLRAWRAGQAQQVEGAIEDFESGRSGKGTEEKFQVGGIRFRYRSNVLTAAFNKVATRGGPMREGLRVRIWYVAEPNTPAKRVERLMRPDGFERRALRLGPYLDQLAAENGFVDNRIVRLEAEG
ncbi:MAG: hypothetical protein AB7M12_00115 [Hyphomonadaceae bacterium]